MNYQNYPQYPQLPVDPRAYGQVCQANQALEAENQLLKDKILGQNWLNQQRDLAREERSAAKKDIAHRSGAKIVKIDGKLCLTSPVGRPYPLMNCAPRQTYYVVPDPLYQVEPYYVLKFDNIDAPVFLSLSTVKNDKAFIHALTQATGESIAMTKGIAKIAMMLRTFLAGESYEIPLGYYAGWKFDVHALVYDHLHGSTHGRRGSVFNPFSSELYLGRGNAVKQGEALLTTEKYADLMDVIPAEEMRSDISMVLHTAFLYSLIRHWGYRFPFGFNFHTQYASVISIMKAILGWYQDGSLTLIKRPEILQDDLLERKDQPIVIEGIEGTHPNCKLVAEVIRTGGIARKNDANCIPLQGLVSIITQHISDLSFASCIATVEMDDKVFRADGLSYIQNYLPYLQEYFMHLAVYITQHAVEIKADFDSNMELFRGLDFGYLSPSAESVEAAGIIHAIAELVHSYHVSLAPNDDLIARLEILTDIGSADRMLNRFVDASCNTDDGVATIGLFSGILQESIESNDLILVEKAIGSVIMLPDSNGKPLVLEDDQNFMITSKALDVIAKKMGVSSPQLLRILADSEILIGARTNSTTYQTRTRVIVPGGSRINIAVYRIDKQKLFDPTLYM